MIKKTPKPMWPVPVSERLPKKEGKYLTNKGELNFYTRIYEEDDYGWMSHENNEWLTDHVEYWYSEIPPPQETKSAEQILNEVFYEHSFEDAYRELTAKPFLAVIEAMEMFAQQYQRHVGIVLPDEEHIVNKGKNEVAYERQVAVCGQKDADMVLYFWRKGFESAFEEIRTRLNVVDPVELLEWFNSEVSDEVGCWKEKYKGMSWKELVEEYTAQQNKK